MIKDFLCAGPAVLPGETGLAAFPLDSPSPYILFDTVIPSSQTGEGIAVEEDEWKECTFHKG